MKFEKLGKLMLYDKKTFKLKIKFIKMDFQYTFLIPIPLLVDVNQL